MGSHISVKIVRLMDSLKRYSSSLTYIVPRSIQRTIYDRIFLSAVHKLPDRVYLEEAIFPALRAMGFAKILSIGVEVYNAGAEQEFAGASTEYWTIDINPDNAKWGSPDRHIVGDALRLHEVFEPSVFDCVILNGVIGYGINGKQCAEQVLESVATVLRPCGWLVLGWNVDRGVSVSELTNVRRFFHPLKSSILPAHITFDRSTHRFDFLVRNDL